MTASGNGVGTHLDWRNSVTTTGGPKVFTKSQRRNRRRKQKQEEVKTDNSLPKGSRKSGYKRKMTELTPSPQMLTTSKKPKEDVQTSRGLLLL